MILMGKLDKYSHNLEIKTKVDKWNEPLYRILTGHEDLLRVTSDFPKLGKLPALGKINAVEDFEYIGNGGERANAAVAVVVVVVCVAVAARPSVASDEIIRAKLLDVYNPVERETLHNAILTVQKEPELIKETLGLDEKATGDMMSRMERVEKLLV